jgi:hypothetical protein
MIYPTATWYQLGNGAGQPAVLEEGQGAHRDAGLRGGSAESKINRIELIPFPPCEGWPHKGILPYKDSPLQPAQAPLKRFPRPHVLDIHQEVM